MPHTPYGRWVELWKYYEDDGQPFIDLSSGSSFLPMPNVLKAQLISSILDDQYIPYAGPAGHPLSIGAIVCYENALLGAGSSDSLTSENVCMTPGASFALYAFLDFYKSITPHREILLLGLNYYFFAESCRHLGLPLDDLCSAQPGAILPTVEELRLHLAAHSPGLVILVLPGNPSGELYSDEELFSICGMLQARGIWFLIDKLELDDISYNDRFVNVIRCAAEAGHRSRTVIVGGTAKTRSLVATRTGYIVGSREVIQHVKDLNHRYMFGPPSLESRFLLLDLFFRSLLFREKGRQPLSVAEVDDQARAWREALGAQCPQHRKDADRVLCDPGVLESQYTVYREQLSARYSILADNQKTFFDGLKGVIQDLVRPQHGANFVVRFPGFNSANQVERCKSVFRKIHVALIPEACFRAHPVAGSAPAWTRISAGLDREPFAEGVARLRGYFQEHPL